MGLARKAEDFTAFVDFCGDYDIRAMLRNMLKNDADYHGQSKESIVYQYLLLIVLMNNPKYEDEVCTAFDILNTVKPKYT